MRQGEARVCSIFPWMRVSGARHEYGRTSAVGEVCMRAAAGVACCLSPRQPQARPGSQTGDFAMKAAEHCSGGGGTRNAY